ncbi:hypothetical protein HK101_008303 [Irineochytrium annulatum]|nr:hypothetical protein HK101_008303 [Irineochytrium annulatum]
MVEVHVQVADVVFEGPEAKYFIKVDVAFGDFEKGSRTDVGTVPTRYPVFTNPVLAFGLPENESRRLEALARRYKQDGLIADVESSKRENLGLTIVVAGHIVDQFPDGGAAVTRVGSATYSIENAGLLLATGKRLVEVLKLTPDTHSMSRKAETVGRLQVKIWMESSYVGITSHTGVLAASVDDRTGERRGYLVELERENSDGGYGKMLLARSLIDLEQEEVVIESKAVIMESVKRKDAICDDGLDTIFNYERANENVSRLDVVNTTATKAKAKRESDRAAQSTPLVAAPFICHDPQSTGGQRVVIHVHDTWDLPLMHNSDTGAPSLPAVFVSAKNALEATDHVSAESSTHVFLPSREASFGERLCVNFKEPYTVANTPSVFISIADNITRRIIAKFVIPISVVYFPSHRQQCLILRSVSPTVNLPSPSLRVSLTNFDLSVSSPYHLQKEYNNKMIYLELLLKGVTPAPMPIPVRCIAVIRLIKNGTEYGAKMATGQRRYKEGYPPIHKTLAPATQLDFDSTGKLISDYPLSRDLFVPHLVYHKSENGIRTTYSEDSFYQMTRSSIFELRPTWNEHFLYCIDMSELGPETSLAIEFYKDPPCSDISPAKPVPVDTTDQTDLSPRSIHEMIAYSIVSIGDFSALPVTEPGRIKNLSVQMNFVDRYGTMAEVDNVYVSLDVKVPDNWLKVTNLQHHLAEHEKKTTQLLNTVDIDLISNEELQKRYVLLAEKFQNEARKYKDVSGRLEEAQNVYIEKRYLEVQQAHMSQQAYIQKLQVQALIQNMPLPFIKIQLDKAAKYKATVRKQEQIITKLETFLKEGFPIAKKEQLDTILDSHPDSTSLESGIYRLLVEENQQLKDRLFEMEQNALYTDSDYVKLLLRAESAEVRVSALEAEIVKGARTFAAELAELRGQVAAKERNIKALELGRLIKPVCIFLNQLFW